MVFSMPNTLPAAVQGIKEALEKIVRATTTRIRTVFRARIVLLSMQGERPSAIARILKTTLGTIRKWLKRFSLHPVLESLEDAPRSGRPLVIPAIAKCEVIKFACSDVKIASQDAENTWTIRALQKCVKKSTGISISKSEINRILNHKDLRPHKVKMWLHSPDPFFQEKVTKICSLYLNPPSDGVVLCIDEKSGMQAVERKRSLSSNGRVRLDYEYKRHGTQSLIASFEPASGKVFGHCGKTRKKEDIMNFMEEIAARYPNQKVYIIWDNLNIHHGYRWYEFNKRHGGRFFFIYTPVHGSWINQIEIWFGILQRRVLKNSSINSEEDLRDKVLIFLDKWNEIDCHPFKWQFRGYNRKVA
jgi:transposase